MSYSKLSIIALFFVLSSCAFNGLFLHPYKLSEESSFNGYSKQLEDTITLSFAGDQPQFHRSNSDTANLDYTIKSINFESKTSDTLNAWLLEPKSNFNGTLIYWLHGNAGHMVYQYQLVTPYVEKGFKVFMLDYSGFGFSSGEATRKNTLQNGCDGFEFMKGMNIPHEKTLIYGQSLGGHLASVVAPLYQDQLDGLVIEGAFNSHKAVASTRVPILPWVFVLRLTNFLSESFRYHDINNILDGSILNIFYQLQPQVFLVLLFLNVVLHLQQLFLLFFYIVFYHVHIHTMLVYD